MKQKDIACRAIYAILLTALLEMLWVSVKYNGAESPGHWKQHAMKVSLGFPVSCLSYTVVKTTGHVPPWENYPDRSEFLPGLSASPFFCIFDALGAMTLFFGFDWLLRFRTGRALATGLLLGAIAGLISSFGMSCHEFGMPVFMWMSRVVLLLGLPVTVWLATRRGASAWTAALMLGVCVAVMSLTDCRCEPARSDSASAVFGFSVTRYTPDVIEAIIFPLLASGVLVIPILLLRKFIPDVERHESTAQQSVSPNGGPAPPPVIPPVTTGPPSVS